MASGRLLPQLRIRYPWDESEHNYFMIPRFFCNLPFTSLISNDGVHARPCCNFLGKNIPVKDYTSNQEILNVKKQLLAGEAPKLCNTCYNNEKIGIPSLRQTTMFHEDRNRSIIEKNDPGFFDFKEILISPSNICNLKCHPCEGGSYIRLKELHGLGFKPIIPLKAKRSSYDWIFDHDLEWLTLAGGEPFVDVVSFDIINKLVSLGKSKKMRIDLNTNMTSIADWQLDLLTNNFKEVTIKASIDGIGSVNEYLRYPSKWPTIMENFQKIRKHSRVSVLVTTALSNLSFLRYHEVIRWAHQEKLDLFITTVTNPKIMHASLLPKALKNNLYPIYQSLKSEIYSTLTDRSKECLDRCIQMCESDIEQGLPDFKETLVFCKKHDSIRPEQNLEKVFPELESYLLG